MDDPIYNSNNIVGGSSSNYTFSAMSREIHSNQSFILIQTFTEADGGGPFDISSSTSTLLVSAFKNATLQPVALTAGVLSDSGGGTIDTVTFTVPKNVIPTNLGSFPQRNGGNCRFFYILEDSDSVLEFAQGVNVIDPSYGLTGTVEPGASTITTQRNDLGTVEDTTIVDPPVQSFELAYIVGPVGATGDWLGQENNLAVSNGTSWIFTLPEEGNFVYDKALGAQKTFGTSWEISAAGAMLESVYDPQTIAADTFDRANMTGTQIASTISDIQTTITNNTEVLANTAKVTNATHTGDVTGDTVLTLANAAITGKATVTADVTDFVLVSDTSDSANLKKVLVSDFIESLLKKKTESGTTYTLTDTDFGFLIYFTNVAGCTVSLNTGLIDGFQATLMQDTATSVITIAGTATLKAGSDLVTAIDNDAMIILPRPTTDEYTVKV